MTDARVQRPKPLNLIWRNARYFVSRPNIDTQEIYLASEAVPFMDEQQEKLETIAALHASILEKIHLTQIAAGVGSQAETLEWIKQELQRSFPSYPQQAKE